MRESRIYCGDARTILPTLPTDQYAILVSDPPFNIGYHYSKYADKMAAVDYYEMLAGIFAGKPHVLIHYSEYLYAYAVHTAQVPVRTVSWVYNSNQQRQHREIAFFNVKPDFSQVRQPYKNPNDKRVRALIASGSQGRPLYDWWNTQQVKNISKEKTAHPCQMPLVVMRNIIGVLPADALIVDPFVGSGTTGVAAKQLGRDFIGIELDEGYVEIARSRIAAAQFGIL